MAEYDRAQTLREARERYFAAAGLGSGGYDQKWVPLAMGPLRFAIPNTAGRVRAVRYHDLHHVVTGYDTDWTGEGEIGAWEVASGCRGFVAAWMLNLFAMVLGSAISPERLFRAFVRGRHSRNLYGDAFDDALLATSVGALRERLDLDGPPPAPTTADLTAFLGWYVAAVCSFVLVSVVVLLPLALLVAWAI